MLFTKPHTSPDGVTRTVKLFVVLLPLLMTHIAPVMARENSSDEILKLKETITHLEAENRQLRFKLTEYEMAPAPHVPEEPPEPIVAEDTRARRGFIDLNYYYDTRDFQNLTINSGAKLPLDFKYYQLLTLKAPLNSIKSKRSDLTSFFTEVNLRHPILKEDPWLGAMDWTIQYVGGTFLKDFVRLGTRVHFHKLPGSLGKFFRESLGLRYSIDFHFYETDGDGWQIEQVYNKQFLDGQFYLKGFIDQNMDKTGLFFIHEHQFGIRVVDEFYAVAELRYKTNNPRRDKWGVGLGGEYIIKF